MQTSNIAVVHLKEACPIPSNLGCISLQKHKYTLFIVHASKKIALRFKNKEGGRECISWRKHELPRLWGKSSPFRKKVSVELPQSPEFVLLTCLAHQGEEEGVSQPGARGATSHRCVARGGTPFGLCNCCFFVLTSTCRLYLDIQEAFHIDREMSENGRCGAWYSLGILAQGCFRKFKFSSVGNAKCSYVGIAKY